MIYMMILLIGKSQGEIKMSWFNIIKIDREERIRGILSNWLDEVLDWLETAESEAVNTKNSMESTFDAMQEIIDRLPEHLKESFPVSKEEGMQIAQGAIDEFDKLKIEIRKHHKLIDDGPILEVLKIWQDGYMIEPIMAIENTGESNPPTPPNIDRLIGQLELGEGYEE